MKTYIYLLPMLFLNLQSINCMLIKKPLAPLKKINHKRKLSTDSIPKLIEALNKRSTQSALPIIYKTVLDTKISPTNTINFLTNQILRPDIDITEKDNLFTLLNFAQQYRHHTNPFFNDETTIVHEAVTKQKLSLLENIISYSTNNIDLLNSNGNRPLYVASSRFCEGSVHLLLQHGANPNSLNEHSKTPLIATLDKPLEHYSQELYGLPSLIFLLMRHGALPLIKDKDGNNAIAYVQNILNIIQDLKKRDDHYLFMHHLAAFTIIKRILEKEELYNCSIE